MKKKKSMPSSRAKKPIRKPTLAARVGHTAKLRESYAQAAEQSLQICKEWEPLDYKLWAKLDKHVSP